MKHCILLLAFTFGAIAPAADRGADAEYIGGTLQFASTQGIIDVTRPDHLTFRTKSFGVRIPYERVNLLEYGQQVDRRYAMAVIVSPLLLLSKKRKHFLTVGYQDDEGRQQAIVLRVDKAHIRPVLASLEARTGLRVQYQDAEARKAGKG